MIYISYYTKGDYEKVMETHLHPSLHKWDLPHDIQCVKDMGSWQANTHFKAQFCKEMLLKHRQSVIFTDADATIENYPLLFNFLDMRFDYDIALHFLDWMLMWRKKKGQDKREALSGTLYLNYNEKVLKFLDEWIELNKVNTRWEQRNMQEILSIWKNKLQIYNLPASYCTIILFNKKLPEHYLDGEKPVIVHHQKSRELRNKNV